MGHEVAQLKGSVVSGYIAWIRAQGLQDSIRPRLPADVAALLDDPPLAISWVETRYARDLLDAIEQLRGIDEVRRLGAETLSSGLLRLLRPLSAGLVRAVGASPPALFARLDVVLHAAVRGYTVQFEERGSQSAIVRLRSVGLADSRAGLVGGWENAFEAVLGLADVRGTARLLHHEMQGADTVATFSLRWEPRSP